MSQTTTQDDCAAPQVVIGVVPYYVKTGRRLIDLPLDQLDWPLGAPAGISGRTVGDLGPDAHLISFPRIWLFSGKLRGMRARISLVIAEPASFHRHYMWLAKVFHRRFYRILSCNAKLLGSIPNGIYFVFGDSWVADWRRADVTKSRLLSLIASNKRRLVGHKLRHRIVKRMAAAGIAGDVMGRGYRAFEDKAEGLAPYRYSVVIENSREPGYFTEKLVDALLLNTVPIYWGAPDIADFFDPAGMLVCQNEAEIMAALARISEGDYAARADAIAANRKAAVKYANMLKSAVRVLEASL